MKKLFSFFATAALALGFTACEDVPAPYEVNDGGNPAIPGQENTIFSTEFDGGATDGFTFSNVSMNGLSYVWTCDASYGYLKASAYAGGACHAAESWAVSPAINLSDCTKATLTFRHAINQIGDTDLMTDMMTVWVCTDYAGDAATASWTQLTVPTYPSGTSWTFVGSDNIDLADFCGKDKVYIGFKYISTDQNAGSWEVDAFKIVGDGTPMEGNEPSTGDVLLSESFTSSLGDFVNYTTSGEGAWVNDFKTACATGYDNGTKLTTAGTYYLVSPEISLEGQTEVHVSYEYILRYDRGQENQQLLISDNFDSSKPAEGWTLLNGTHKEGVDYVTFETADVDIPASYMGKKIRIALRFNSDAVSSATWEVKNFTVQAGKASDNPDTPTPSGDNLLTNGGFETWNSSSEPSGWKSASTASNATLSQSSDAHSGSYSVCVGGATSGNKRLGSAEMTLKPGTYAVRFYAKAATTEGGTVCPGYVPVTDGKVGSYKYGSYVNDLSASEWTEVNHTFTLDEQTTLCLVVMNSKTPGKDVLIDDFSLTTANGGLVGGGGGEQPGETPSTGTLSWDFIALGGQGGWTVDNKQMPSDLSYIWTFDSKYGMKASAFANSTNYDTESWLISPELDLSALSTATLTINHAGKFFGSIENEAQVKISADGTNWTNVALSDYPTGWTFVEATANINALAGKKGVRIALVYSSTSAAAGTWEVDKVSIK